MRFLCLILLSACAAKKANTAAVDNATEAPQPETSPPTASSEDAPASSEQPPVTIAEQPEAASDPAAEEQLTVAGPQPETVPEPEKPMCSEEADHTLNLTSLRITKGVDGMTPIAWIYRDVSFVDGSKHEVTCLSTVETTCVFGDCTNFTKCCDRTLPEPEPPQPDTTTIANQSPSS